MQSQHPPHHLLHPPLSQTRPFTPPLSTSPSPGQMSNNGAKLWPTNPNSDTRTQLYVGNLPFRVRWQDLKDLMRKCGTVLRADVALTPIDGRSRGFGVVLFSKEEDAWRAIEKYNGYVWQTRALDVRLDTQDPTGVLAIAEANRQQALQSQQHQPQQHQAPQHPSQFVGLWPPQMAPNSVAMSPLQMPMPPVRMPSPSPHPLYAIRPTHAQPPPFEVGEIMGAARPREAEREQPGESRSKAVSPALSSASPPLANGRDTAPTVIEVNKMGWADEEEDEETSDAQVEVSLSSPSLPIALPSPPPALPIVDTATHDRASTPFRHFEQLASTSPAGHQSTSPSFHGMHPPNGQSQMGGSGIGGSHNIGMPMGMHPQSHPSMFNGGHQGIQQMMGDSGYGRFQQPHQYQQTPQQQYLQSQQRGLPPPNPSLPPGYHNRHLFVGNLPFNCQWQELKDLMRGAGAVLRADIAQGPDGRSRGFGSVLFSTPQDADRAVQMFNGYDYNGRGLKVHFDKFATSMGPSSTTFGLTSNGNYPYPHSSPQAHHAPMHPSTHPHMFPHNTQPFMQPQQNGGDAHHRLEELHHEPPSTNAPPPPSSDTGREQISYPDAADPPSTSSSEESHSPRHHASPPGRISMPPSYSFSGGPLSPMQGRLPPMPPMMTPSMPAFTFGAYPATPPLYPQFFSPGLGPFSPPMGGGSPYFAPSHFMNAAPGAPVHRDVEVPRSALRVESDASQVLSPASSHTTTEGETTPSAATGNSRSDEPSYFPPVPPSDSPSLPVDDPVPQLGSLSLQGERTPPPPAKSAPSSPPASSISTLAAPAPVSDDPDGTSSASGSLSTEGGSGNARRRSFVPGAAGVDERSLAFDIRRRFEGPSERRASFEDAATRKRPAFGSSIWAAQSGSALD